MSRIRRIVRVAGPLVLAAMIIAGALPRVAMLRCLMMGTVVLAPCCPPADHDRDNDEAPSDRLVDGDCFERIPGGVPTIRAVRASTEHRSTAAPVGSVVLWTAPRAPLSSPVEPGQLVTTRGSPAERRLRVPTVLLRV